MDFFIGLQFIFNAGLSSEMINYSKITQCWQDNFFTESANFEPIDNNLESYFYLVDP